MQASKFLLCMCVCQFFLGYSSIFAQSQNSVPAININETSINHTISTTFEFTETAINRFLQNQYSTGSIPPTSSGTVDGVTYTLNLELPEIILVQDEIKLHMAISIVSSLGNYSVSIDPTLSLPAWNISLTEIDATLANLTTVVNVLSLDTRLKTAIINSYNSIVVQLYPSKLLSQINTTALSQKSINFLNASLQSQIFPGLLRFIVTITLKSALPVFWVAAGGYEGDDYIHFLSNIEMKIKEVIVVPLSGSPVLYHGYPDVTCPKDSYVSINMGDQGIGTGGVLIVKARFQTDDTWFVREYGMVPVNYSSWVGETKKIN